MNESFTISVRKNQTYACKHHFCCCCCCVLFPFYKRLNNSFKKLSHSTGTKPIQVPYQKSERKIRQTLKTREDLSCCVQQVKEKRMQLKFKYTQYKHSRRANIQFNWVSQTHTHTHIVCTLMCTIFVVYK